MGLFTRWITNVLHAFNVFTLSPFDDQNGVQEPLFDSTPQYSPGQPPEFVPPSAPKGSEFECKYPDMTDWKYCSTPQNRGCWLRHKNGTEYNITSDYENYTPRGILREYTLDLAYKTLNADGVEVDHKQLFNGSLPGPWLQACWGDTLKVTIKNNVKYNGTTIHWHGIRQLGSLEMDGVNGVTQCPIKPYSSFTYTFNLTQYGTSWYHSHYSLQYGDGALGPLTIHGPSSANFDSAVDPLLMSDYLHRSAFHEFHKEFSPSRPTAQNMVLNGVGQCACIAPKKGAPCKTDPECGEAPEKPCSVWKEGKKYLLRIINTSVDTTFIFSIDAHNLQVITADFVPIKPYTTDSILVGIGQRYNVIVEAIRPLPEDNYWMRMTPADNCNSFDDGFVPQTNMGIIRYNESNTATPSTTSQKFPTECSDEPYESLIPMLPWKVGRPANEQRANTFEVGFQPSTSRVPWGNISRWELGTSPLWINFADPTILHIKNKTDWDNPKYADLAVVNQKQVTSPESWIYLLITSTNFPSFAPNRRFVPAAHPLHLHGHDFAIVAQSKEPYWDHFVKMKQDNPPRRDVALLPANGYLIIAFKADNPGSWLLHCHIAWHASSGLALQIMERERDIPTPPGFFEPIQKNCAKWQAWFADPNNLWTKNQTDFQDDSGV